MQGILLIGMPGVGKSTVGKKIAELLGFNFIDGDIEIERSIPDRQTFLDTYGDEFYVNMEELIITNFSKENAVLAPGGSIIYSQKCKDYFSDCFKVFLDAPIDVIKHRLENVERRGIVYLKKLGMDALYNQRKLLFEKYADIILDAESDDVDRLVKLIVNTYCMQHLTKEKYPIAYISTNGESESSFTEAMLHGLAPDKGLFVPQSMPLFSKEEIKLMGYLTYAQLAFVVMRLFVDIDDERLKQMCEDAYNFGLPIEQHENLSIARLDQGPSASFKDFGVRLLAQMMDYITEKENRKIIILTATSGDTGSAVATAFHCKENTKAVILMPAEEITTRQRRQMTTLGGNIIAVLIKGKFDDCQSLVKGAFAEVDGLSSANSINIGRLLPQIVYYFYVYCRTNTDMIVVPSGNFGNLVSGAMSKRMGLPVKFIAAVNENDEVPQFLETGKYQPVIPSKKCISNAMNVGNPSNLARLIWLYGGIMTEGGELIKMPDMEKLKGDILSVSVTDDETRQAMKRAYEKGIVLEPHGAVGWMAIEKLKNNNLGNVTLLETAHPAKFPEELDALGISYEVPVTLSEIDESEENYITMEPNLDALKNLINSLK